MENVLSGPMLTRFKNEIYAEGWRQGQEMVDRGLPQVGRLYFFNFVSSVL